MDQVHKIYEKYNKKVENEEDKISINKMDINDKHVGYYICPSKRLSIEQRVDIYKEVIKYIKCTRKDLIRERYNKGGCMKYDIMGYKNKWGGYDEEEYWDTDTYSNYI